MERFVIITGLSGSGKTLAANCLEDLGYYCVDNLPVQLIPPFYDLIQRNADTIRRAALVIDIRGGEFLKLLPEIVRNLRTSAAPVEMLFFDCDDDTLKRRFSETRRPHPMAETTPSLETAIVTERRRLREIRDLADRLIDTSRLTAHELRAFLKSSFGTPHEAGELNVNVLSFGFKYGVPAEADLVFDVRFLPNPHFVDDLRGKTGRDDAVREFLHRHAITSEFQQRLHALIDFLIPRYVQEGKSYLTIALGCTGGKHRSVALAEELGQHLSAQSLEAVVHHRDLGKE